ncbi:hypothetical protein PF005_g15324 [Phytophthora fragariae]|uniref:Secreted protein n=2 Tax=Phytophthora TaxID=4783 RepID=A0A6A3XD15_9STRA|nr:hypothetical protein PF003_g24881 [Phytophthora fragariae]KAE8993881.1 hypothetical protein PR002_g20103 [Phytophthora rubi]KAE8935033.1 hypothetical protein PF009_g15001 [Phytophthora fragariae]KAE8982109.1 hypothetical protein PF011_g21754 [Phytophthora fragariae]KAE8994045.1 hypothetical protein PR001_g20506 [Phytophthora rubi]
MLVSACSAANHSPNCNSCLLLSFAPILVSASFAFVQAHDHTVAPATAFLRCTNCGDRSRIATSVGLEELSKSFETIYHSILIAH